MDLDNIVIESFGSNVKIVRINKPKKKNALDFIMYKTISRILEDATRDDAINIVVLTGTGDFFSSGNDLTARNVSSDSDFYSALNDFIKSFIVFPKILIAMVNGPAIGIAATTLALCDLVYASENSYFYTPFTKLGFMAEGCSTYTFSRIMGERKALDMLLFNYKMSAKEALQCGFVNDIFKQEDLQQNVWNKLRDVTNLRCEILIANKKLIRGHIRDKLLEINEIELTALRKIMNNSKL
ncbi:unnamed protein product [Diatraea saccharalis]|uniref:Enoyl-CoA delta isomerase 2, mitochondrial n=1 Tax=Diatraea saccharalis TaxID=40085 RepID=A0A9N9WIA3_9NEOP|nr:unnamed protein product [Diatraea saccharalis]